jgi:transcription antitermination protein NusB
VGARTAAREAALQMLYAADLGAHEPSALIHDFWREFPADAEERSYADGAVRGVLAERDRIDESIRQASTNWRIERMSPVARNVLRLGSWELMGRHDIPRAVIIDESVELAKRFGGTEAASFVNGVLDRIADTCGRKDEPRGKGVVRGAPEHVAPPSPTSGVEYDVTEEDGEDTP